MEIKQLVKVSQKGTLNSTDWRSLLWTLLIQIAAAIVTALIGWVTYLSNQSELPAWLVMAIPIIQLVLVQVGKALQKLLDGPTKELVEAVQAGRHVEGFQK